MPKTSVLTTGLLHVLVGLFATCATAVPVKSRVLHHNLASQALDTSDKQTGTTAAALGTTVKNDDKQAR